MGYCLRIQVDPWSAFRPCDRDVVEFFNSSEWALYGKLACRALPRCWPTPEEDIPSGRWGRIVESPSLGCWHYWQRFYASPWLLIEPAVRSLRFLQLPGSCRYLSFSGRCRERISVKPLRNLEYYRPAQ